MEKDKTQPREKPGTLDASPASRTALSQPDYARFHAVADDDIKRLRRIETPVALTISAVTTGICLAGAYEIIRILKLANAGGAALTLGDVGLMVGWGATFGVAFATAIFSMHRRSKIIEALDAIRRRPRVPVAPELMTALKKTRGRGTLDPRDLVKTK